MVKKVPFHTFFFAMCVYSIIPEWPPWGIKYTDHFGYLFVFSTYSKYQSGERHKHQIPEHWNTDILNNKLISQDLYCRFCGHLNFPKNGQLTVTVNIKFTILGRFILANLGLSQICQIKLPAKLTCFTVNNKLRFQLILL